MTSPESTEDKALVEIQAVSQQASNVSSRLSYASQVQTMRMTEIADTGH